MSERSLSGIWYSSAGSRLELEEQGSVLSGKFDSAQSPEGFVAIHGSVDPDPTLSHRALSFSASWAAAGTPAGQRSVTSYSGQYRVSSDGSEEIEVIFLLVDDTKSSALWKSTHISTDVFKRTSPK
ncbi:MAG TPA: avidin/streptavidin family protein [Kofleriaceae bacterium]|nr:avidin/streptavidin family protein [Kofleriaceae bacterium]